MLNPQLLALAENGRLLVAAAEGRGPVVRQAPTVQQVVLNLWDLLRHVVRREPIVVSATSEQVTAEERHLHLTIEAPATHRIVVLHVESSSRWFLMDNPTAGADIVTPVNASVGNQREAKSTVRSQVSETAMDGKPLGHLGHVPVILVPASSRVGFNVPFRGEAWMAMHYYEQEI